MSRFSLAPLVVLALSTLAGCDDTAGDPYTFTVFFEDDDRLATPAAPLANAVVTVDVQGETIAGTTDDAGQVTFGHLEQPFYVTAQHEVDFGDEVGRLATTVRVDDTTSREFGLMVLGGGEDFEAEGDPDPATTITGQVVNVPPVPDGFVVDVIAAIDGGTNSSTTVLQGPTTTSTPSVSFSVSDLVPGEHVVYAAIRRDLGSQSEWLLEYRQVALLDERIAVSHQQSATAPDVDFEGTTIEFAETPLTVDGWAQGGVGPIFDVEVDLGSEGSIPIGIHGAVDQDAWTAPGTLWLAETASEGLVVSNAFGNWTDDDRDDEWQQGASLPLGAEVPLAFDMIPRMSMDDPTHGDVLPADAAEGTTLRWSGGDPAAALTTVVVEGEPASLDVDFVVWLMFLPGDATEVTLPGTDLPMLAPGPYGLEVADSHDIGMSGPLSVDDFASPEAPDDLLALFPPGYWHDSEQAIGFEIQ